jgi:hypothetical protein
MVLKAIHISFRKLLVFTVLVILFSCEKPITGILNCSECMAEEPVTVSLEIKVGYQNTPAEIYVYEGNLEDNILLESFFSTSDKVTRTVPVNKKYTVTAVYLLESDYIAVNSVYPRVVFDDESCDEPCYYVYNNKVDLRLKYTK